jgi:putative ABC transport system permease protein
LKLLLPFNRNRGIVLLSFNRSRIVSIRVALSRVLDLVLRRRRDELLADEIQSHLDQLAADYAARGMTPAEAQLAARRAFGGIEQTKEAYRDQRGLPVADALTQDVRFAMRLLRRDRGYSLTAVLVLALGIGVNNMLFTVLNAHTIRGLPIDRVDRVVYVSTFDDRTPDRGLSFLDFEDLRGATRSVNLAAFVSAPMVMAEDERAAERLDGAFVSENAFSLLGADPVLGRTFAQDDARSGAERVAILGTGAWTSRYGADRSILGRSILVDGRATVIIGVMPTRSGFPSSAEIWLPLAHMPGLMAQTRDARTLSVFGRVQEAVSVGEARTEIESIVERLSREHPDTSKNVRARVVPINDHFLGRLTDPAWLAFMTVGFVVVLISCANVANLVLANAAQRAREIAVRSSLGASRRRILRQLLIEGTVLAAVGGTLGLLLAAIGVRLFRTAIPPNVLPYWLDYALDARVFVALVTVSAATVFLFGLPTAIHASKIDVIGVLKDGGPTATTRRGTQRWTTAFLAVEFGLAVLLLAQLTMTLRNARPEVPTDEIIDSRQVITAAITLPAASYQSADQRNEFYRRLHERLTANPAISAISVASTLPLQGAPQQRLEIQGRPPADDQRPSVRTVMIAPKYFQTLGLTLPRGRDFRDEDGAPGQAYVIVNERLVRELFAGQEPIGQRISFAPSQASSVRNWLTIVGVAPDIRQRTVPEPDAVVYVPYRTAAPPTAVLLIRSHADAADLAPSIRREVQFVDPQLPLYRMRTMAQAVRDAQWNGRLSATLIRVLTLIAVGLSAVGLYAVTSYSVSRRTHELGLRVTLGARPRHVATVLGRRVLVQLTFGFFAGVLSTILWERMFSSGGPGPGAADPLSLTIVAAMLTGIAVIACAVPIHRATRLDPVQALRRGQ